MWYLNFKKSVFKWIQYIIRLINRLANYHKLANVFSNESQLHVWQKANFYFWKYWSLLKFPMEYFTPEDAENSVWEAYYSVHGKEKEDKEEDAYTLRKRFERKVYRLLIMHNVPYSKKNGKYKTSFIKRFIHTPTL